MNRGPLAGPENRRALIDAAIEIFAEDGVDAPLSAVAKRAGVGQGSLYRHFPDRMALAHAVFDESVQELEFLAAKPDGGLAELLELIVQQMLVSVALIRVTIDAPDDGRAVSIERRLLAIIEVVLDRERARGSVSPEISAEDVLLLCAMLAGSLPHLPASRREAQAKRAVELYWRAFSA